MVEVGKAEKLPYNVIDFQKTSHKPVRIKEVLAGPSSVGFRNKEWTDVAISVPREFPNSRGQGPDEDGCRQGIVPLKECDGLEVPPWWCWDYKEQFINLQLKTDKNWFAVSDIL